MLNILNQIGKMEFELFFTIVTAIIGFCRIAFFSAFERTKNKSVRGTTERTEERWNHGE